MRPHKPTSALMSAAALCALAAAAPLCAHAQSPAPRPAAAVPISMSPASIDSPLVIPMPAGATVQVEMNLSDDDLLGVFKSLLRGVSEGANAVPIATKTSSPPGSGTDTGAQVAQIISNADLSDIFRDVTHLRFILLQTGPATPTVTMMTPQTPGKHTITHAAPPPSLPDQTGFYETAFAGEGGHRLIYTNFDPIHVLMTSFGHARGWAMMAQYPGGIAIMRADGYPDLSKLSSLATQIGAVAAKDQMHSMHPSHLIGK